MKLAFCAYVYFPFGGLQKNFLNIAQACAQAGHEVSIFIGRWEGDKPDNIRVVELGHKGVTNQRKNRYYFSALKQQLSHQNFDLVIGFNRMPMLDVYYAADVCFADKIANKPEWLKWLNPRYRNYLAWEKEVFDQRSPTQILAISPVQKGFYQHYYQTPEQSFHFLPPGINKSFQVGQLSTQERARGKAQQREKLGIRSDEIALFFIGSGYRRKGLDRAIDAVAQLRKNSHKISLYVIGSDKEPPYRQLAKKHKIEQHIHFLGGRDDLSSLIQAADILVHPARFENTGNVLLEAVIAGIPVICTADCGYSKYIEDANAGIVVSSPYSQEAFQSAIERLADPVNGRALRQQYSEAGAAWGLHADIYRRYEYVVSVLESFENLKPDNDTVYFPRASANF